MRLPWIQVDADGQTRARLLGRLLGVPETQGIGMAISLWTWALEMSPEGDFTGEVHGDPELISAAVSWPEEDTPRLIKQLQRVGLVATAPALRVRGLDKYKRTWERNRRPFGGKLQLVKSADSGTTVPGSPANPRGFRAEDGDGDGDVTTLVPQQAPTKPRRERKPSAAEDFFAWTEATRASRGLSLEARPPKATINAVFGPALVDVGRKSLEGRYLDFLGDSKNAAKDPPWPWQVFAKTYGWRKPDTQPPPPSEWKSFA